MKTQLFRQISLERLSSPEQLDQMLRVTSGKIWAALLAIFLLLVTALVWGYTGAVVTTASGQGVIIRTGGVLNVVTRGAGVVIKVNAQVGEKLEANQVVATIQQPVLEQKVKAMRETLNALLREHDHAQRLRQEAAKLQVQALERDKANSELQVSELTEQAKLAADQFKAEDQLFSKGLITKQQALTAKQKMVDIQDKIAGLKAHVTQLEAQRFTAESAPQQEDTDQRTRISTQQLDLEEAEKELAIAKNVVTPYAGQVLELKIYPGSTVEAGQPILSIQPDAESLELVLYLPSNQAKETKAGMEVQISPATIKREEYGFMKGEVVHVADYPATKAAIMRNFENESLVTSLTGSSPVTEVVVSLKTNPRTPSHFQWSTAQGPPVAISSGTICNVQVVTHREKPITLLFPYVKEKLGLS
jgi:HlyD family secretion protein